MKKHILAKRLHTERPSTSREETSAEKRLRTIEPPVKSKLNNIFEVISADLSCDEWHLLGIKLELDLVVLDDLEKKANINKERRELTIVRMLVKWQQKMKNLSDEERVLKLKTALAHIGRNDIAAKIQEEVADPADVYADLLKKIQEVLKKIFKHVTLPTPVWLDKKILPLEEFFVELTMKYVDKRVREVQNDISKEEVFLETAKGIPRRILIEAQPGYGKTTLVAKFLSDWARGEKYLTDRFDLVFVIYLRYYTGNLRDHLLKHCERVKTSEENKMRVIESIKERVLLLLDGFDEIPSDVKDKIFPLIVGDEYPEMTVVVTCRVGFLKVETKSDKLIKRMKIKSLETESIWDIMVKIEGVTPDKRKEFFQKYLNVNDEKLGEQLSQTNIELNDLYECPLFLLLLAVLVQEKDFRPIKTKTELYKTIVNFVINRGLERLTGNTANVDVFDLKSESDEFHCRNLLFNFGKLCVEKIKKQSLNFEKSELLKCSNGNGDDEDLIFKLGFLSKQVIFFNYEEKEHFEPIHRSYLEFSAAFYLSLSDEMETEIQELVSKWNIWPRGHQLLYPFLEGLLYDNAFKMFNAFSAFKDLITIFSEIEYNVRNVLLEIPETEENLKSLEYLAIGDWDYVEYEELLHFWFVGLMKSRSEEITLNIPRNLDLINGVSDDINVDEHMVNESIKGKNIHCENLIIILHEISTVTSAIKEISKLEIIIRNIKAEKVSLKIEWFLFKELFRYFSYYFVKRLREKVLEKFRMHFPEIFLDYFYRDIFTNIHEYYTSKLCTIFSDKVSFCDESDVRISEEYCWKIQKTVCEEFLEKVDEELSEIIGVRLSPALTSMYKKFGLEYCRHFGWEILDLSIENIYRRISENLGEIIEKFFHGLILYQEVLVLVEVIFGMRSEEVVFVGDHERDLKCQKLGAQICSRIGMKLIKKILINEIIEKIFWNYKENLVQRTEEESCVLIEKSFDTCLKWINEPEFPFSIYHLSLHRMPPNVFTVVAPSIQDLIQNQRLQYGIKIQFTQGEINDSFKDDYNSFVEIATISHLKSFIVENSYLHYPLPFPLSLFNKEERMEFIGLKGQFEGINVDQIKTVSVDHFDCVGLRLGKRSLLLQLISRDMKKLSCDCDLINDLGVNDSVFEREKWQTIDQLEIFIEKDKMENQESFLKGISLFHNIREIGLLNFEEEGCNIGFVTYLSSIEKIHYYGKKFPKKFFSKLLEKGEKGLCLDAVEFELRGYLSDIPENDIKDLQLCLENNIFLKFSVVSYDSNDFEQFLKHFISKRQFKVSSQLKEIPNCIHFDRKLNECRTFEIVGYHLNICLENVNIKNAEG